MFGLSFAIQNRLREEDDYTYAPQRPMPTLSARALIFRPPQIEKRAILMSVPCVLLTVCATDWHFKFVSTETKQPKLKQFGAKTVSRFMSPWGAGGSFLGVLCPSATNVCFWIWKFAFKKDILITSCRLLYVPDASKKPAYSVCNRLTFQVCFNGN